MSQFTTLHKYTFSLNGLAYKRPKDFVKSPFRYPGGKFYALQHILPFILCVPHDEFREPFVGGGTVFFAKPTALINWINDLETDLTDTYQVIADVNEREELCSRLLNEVADRERHSEIKNYIPHTKIDIAFKTFYLNRTSYSGIINKPAWGYKHGKSSPPQNWSGFIQRAGEKLEGVKITNVDFAEVIKTPPQGDRVLMYLDPPYFHADQKRAYTKPFTEKDHFRLAGLLRNTEYLFCLSYDDCEEIRDLYTWADIHEQTWLYNTANKKGEQRQKGNELVITNYTVLRMSQVRLKL